MAAATASSEATFLPNFGYGCVKDLAESGKLTSIPSNYAYSINSEEGDKVEVVAEEEVQIPTIDYSLLTSTSPEERSKAIQELGKACEEWGFFMVIINHGVPEKLMEKVFEVCGEFFNQREEEKMECAGKQILDPIRCGTSFNSSVEKVNFWRDYLKVLVHPNFYSPPKPPAFSELSFEYCNRTREIARELLRGISESLGLEESYIDKAMELDSCFQIFIANLYPPCPQPELAMGMPPHSDHGLLTLLIQNGIGGLQIKHKGKWINVKAVPNSFLVNTADHLEIVSNGKYKSVLHRAVVNSEATRISIAMAHGPCLDKVITPASELVDNKNNPAMYHGMKYKDYLILQQSNQLNLKFCLDRIRV